LEKNIRITGHFYNILVNQKLMSEISKLRKSDNENKKQNNKSKKEILRMPITIQKLNSESQKSNEYLLKYVIGGINFNMKIQKAQYIEYSDTKGKIWANTFI
jgi:hypothetical protein